MSVFDAARPHPAGYRDLLVPQLSLPVEGYRLVDVREPAEFTGELGHIAGAQLVPLASLTAQASGWDKNGPIVLVCRSGGRSANGAQALLRLGFAQVMNLVGGMLEWNSAGRSVEK